MKLGIAVILGILCVAAALLVAAVKKLEDRAALWEEFRHPPDREDEEEKDRPE